MAARVLVIDDNLALAANLADILEGARELEVAVTCATNGQAGLREVMMTELYVLQYHLYTVALDRYLAFRIPEYQYRQHFGGVYYLFLRGMSLDGGSEYGVFRDRPSETLIRELSRCLHAAKSSA